MVRKERGRERAQNIIASSKTSSIFQQEDLEEIHSQTDITKMEDTLTDLRGEKKRLDETGSRLQQELSAISRQSLCRGALEALRKEKRTKEDVYQNE